MSLIELVTVVAIILILLGLTASAVFRVSGSQTVRTAELQVEKVSDSLDQQWKKVVEDAKREPIKDVNNGGADQELALMNICGNDNDRARSLWIRMRLWQEFPHRFDEVITSQAANPTAATLTVSGNGSSVSLQSKAIYRRALANLAPANPDPGVTAGSAADRARNLESAALLLLAVSSNRGGMSQNVDDMMGPNGQRDQAFTGGNLKVFTDPWGTPIAYRRYGVRAIHSAYLTELNSAPYTRANTSYKDALDPGGKFQTNWLQPAADPRPGIFQAIYPGFGTNNFPTGANTQNLAPFVFSAGPNRKFHQDDGTGAAIDTTARSSANDDIVSYRLRRVGNRGD